MAFCAERDCSSPYPRRSPMSTRPLTRTATRAMTVAMLSSNEKSKRVKPLFTGPANISSIVSAMTKWLGVILVSVGDSI